MELQQIALVTCKTLGNYTDNAEPEQDLLCRFRSEKLFSVGKGILV